MDSDEFVLSRKTASPRAQELMSEDWFWTRGDDNSPFGSSCGDEALAELIAYAPSHGDTIGCLDQLLREWGVGTEIREVCALEELAEVHDYCSTDPHDEAAISFAFGQLVLQGEIEPEVERIARLALERQLMQPCLESWNDEGERRHRVERMLSVLRSASGT